MTCRIIPAFLLGEQMSISTPIKFPVPFANTGARNTIPLEQDLVPGKAQFASLQTGFPQVTMMPIERGGIPPSGMDFNGILHAISSNIQNWNAGVQMKFDEDFCTKIGGYPKGAVLQSNDGKTAYVSTKDNNTGDFNTHDELIGEDWILYGGEDFATKEEVTSKIAEVNAAISAIPEQVNADWNASEGKAKIENKPELAEVATSGKYTDLTDTPDEELAKIETLESGLEAVKTGYTKTDFSNITSEARKIMANMWVPSSLERKSLTFPSKGDGTEIYQATDDGWFYIYMNRPVQIALYIYADANKSIPVLGISHSSTSSLWSTSAFVPIAKGHYVVPLFTTPSTSADRKFFTFIKARGAALE